MSQAIVYINKHISHQVFSHKNCPNMRPCNGWRNLDVRLDCKLRKRTSMIPHSLRIYSFKHLTRVLSQFIKNNVIRASFVG